MPTPFHDSVYRGNVQKDSVVDPKYVKEMTEVYEKFSQKDSDVQWPEDASGDAMLSTITIRTNAKGNLEQRPCAKEEFTFKKRERYQGPVKAWEYEMSGHIDQTIERYTLLANKDISSLRYVATPCIDDHLLSPADHAEKGELSPVAAKIVLKGLFVARFARMDILWSICILARMVTKWTVGGDKRLHRLISYLYHHKHKIQQCWLGDYPEHCQLLCYVDASFAGDTRDSKSSSGAYLIMIGPRTCIGLGWFHKKQTATSHSSSESELICLDAAIRILALPALMLWDEIMAMYCPFPVKPRVTSCHPIDIKPECEDYPPQRGVCTMLEDNEAVMKMTIKQRSPHMQYVNRTHRVNI